MLKPQGGICMSPKIIVTIKFSNEPSDSSIKNFSRVLEDIYNNYSKRLKEVNKKEWETNPMFLYLEVQSGKNST